MTMVRIRHRDSGLLIADGPLGWGITPFDGSFYIRRRHLKTHRFKVNYIPGICFYKLLYVWLDLELDERQKSKSLGWMYWLPNPFMPFIWFRVAVPMNHPEIEFEEYGAYDEI